MDPQTKLFLDIIDRVGLLGFLVIFATIFFWRYLPSLMKKWKAQEAQANIVAEAIPQIKDSLARMAEGNEMLKEILGTVSRVEKALAEIREEVLNDRVKRHHREAAGE